MRGSEQLSLTNAEDEIDEGRVFALFYSSFYRRVPMPLVF